MSQFGGIPVESGSQFGGIAVEAPKRFADRMQEDFNKRKADIAASQAATTAGDRWRGVNLVNNTGQGIGLMFDAAGNAIGSLARELPQGVQDAGKQAFGAYTRGAQQLGQAAGEAMPKVGEALGNAVDYVGQRIQNNPEAADFAGGIVNIVGALPLGMGAKQGVKAASKVGEVAGDVTKYAALPVLEKLATPAQQTLKDINLKEVSSKLYNSARANQELLTPDLANNFSKVLNEAYVAPMPNGQFTEGGDYLNKILDRYKGFEGKPLTIAQIDDLDKNLGGDIQRAYKGGYNQEAGQLKDIQSKLRDDFRQVPAGGELKQAIDLWSAGSAADEINGIIETAKMTKNPQTAMQTGFKNLYKKYKDKPMGRSPEELAALKKAGTSGVVTDLLSTFGSRLGPLMTGAAGYATMGPIGGAVAGGADYLIAKGLRKGAETLQESRATQAFNKIAQRPAVAEVLQGGVKPSMVNKAAQSILNKIKTPAAAAPAKDNVARIGLLSTIKNMTPEEELAFIEANLARQQRIKSVQQAAGNEYKAANQAVAQPTMAKQGIATPVTTEIMRRGGVQVGSKLDVELRNMGINPTTAPGLFKKGRGLKDVDNIPHSEVAKYNLPSEISDNGYANRQAILDAMGDEHNIKRGLKSGGMNDAYIQDLEYQASSHGIDVIGKTPKQIEAELKEAIAFDSFVKDNFSMQDSLEESFQKQKNAALNKTKK